MAASPSSAALERVHEPVAARSVRLDDGTKPVAQCTDIELAALAQQQVGEASVEAFEELVRRLEGPLFGFLSVRVGNAADAEELTQDAFLRAWNKLDRYDSRWRFSTWLFTIAKRLAVSRARVRRPDALADEVLATMSEDVDPSAGASDREESANLWRLASEILSSDQRSALWLRYAEDLTNEEIARVLGKKRVTVRVLLFRAREALAKAIDEPGAAPNHNPTPAAGSATSHARTREAARGPVRTRRAT